MKIAIACDHGALDLKNALVARLTKQGYEVEDFGTHTLDSCDYPDFAGLPPRLWLPVNAKRASCCAPPVSACPS